MLISDFLTSQAPHSDDLAWVGSPLPTHPALMGMPVADSDKRAPVQVSAVRRAELPGCLACLDGLAGGDRAVLLTDALPAEPATRDLAVALADRGCELLHAVYVDDAASIQVVGGLSIQRVRPGADGDDLASTNLEAVTVAGGTEPNWERTRAAFAKIAAQYEDAVGDVAKSSADLRSVKARSELAEARLDAVRDSTTMHVGSAMVDLAQHPLRVRRVTRTLRTAWQQRHRPSEPMPAPSPPVTRDRRPWLEFRAPMPIPPKGARSRPMPLHLDVPASYVVARVLKRDGVGGYEPSTMAWYLALCDTAQPGAVWDVGADLGLYSLLARAYCDREVVAFEPTPDLASWGGHLAAINDLDYRLEQLAAGESAGTATLHRSETSDASNSLTEGSQASTSQLDVLVEPLDRYSRRTGSVPAVMKVGTETTEHFVLRGARQVIAEHRPWIFCEVLADRAPEKVLTELMGELGYRFFHLDGSDPLIETDTVRGDPAHKSMNYLFAPAALDDHTVESARAWDDALEATPRPAR